MNTLLLIALVPALALFGYLIYLFVTRVDNQKEKRFLFNSVFLYLLLFIILQPLLLDINTSNIIQSPSTFLALFLYVYWFLSVSVLINQFAPPPGVIAFPNAQMSTREVYY